MPSEQSTSSVKTVETGDFTFRVSGSVRRSDRKPAAGLVVRAYDVDFRREELLGETTTDADGAYHILYKPGSFARAEKKNADLVVRAFDRGVEKPAAESRVVFNAGQVAEIDLLLAKGLSEWERYGETLQPLTDQVSPADFSPEDIRFLTGESEIPAERLLFLAVAHRHAQTTKIPPEAFYAFFRGGLPTGLAALFLIPSVRLQNALETAIRENLIPGTISKEQAMEAVNRARAGSLLASGPDAPAKRLAASGLSREAQEKSLELYLKNTGSIDEFWDALRREPGVTWAQVDDLQFTLRLDALTRNNPVLVSALKNRAKSLDDLADLEPSDWEALIKSAHSPEAPLPPDLPGETDGEKITNFAGFIRQALRDAAPMAFVRRGVAKSAVLPAALRTDLSQFLNGAADFDLSRTHIDSYVAGHPDLLKGAADPVAVVTTLKSHQRVHQITNDFAQTEALVSGGYHSAYSVASVPWPAFLNEMGSKLGGELQTKEVYLKSSQKSAAMTQAMGAAQQFYYGVTPSSADTSASQAVTTMPSWMKLFGSLDLCACDDCRSVYGPAAYLVDLLQFLRKSGSAFTALKKRRPDIEQLKLSCENTNTPIPYIDLVNEILEFYVVHGDPVQWPAAQAQALAQEMARDTGDATAGELSVNDPYDAATETAAYETLKQAVFTDVLPFHRPLETVRTYLDHLDVRRDEVMSVFQNTNAQTPTDLDIALESLRVSPEAYAILVGASSAEPWRFFGYPTNLGGAWLTNLGQVPEFLRRTGVRYPDVVELLKMRFINPVQTAPFLPNTLVLFAPDSGGDLVKTVLRHLEAPHALTEAEWTKLHRVLRLWGVIRRAAEQAGESAWTLQELDLAITAFGGAAIDESLIRNLSHAVRLQAELKLPAAKVLSLWAPIDTFGPESLYIKLFQNKAVLNPVDTAFALNAAGTEVADLTATLQVHSAQLLASLRINAEELLFARQATGLEGETETLTLAKISLLYRHSVFARALKLPMKDFLALKALTGQDPFANPAATEAFVRQARQVNESRFKPALLDYLFRHVTAPGIAPAQETSLIVLQTLQDGLQKIIGDNQPLPDPTGELLKAHLTAVVPPDAVEPAFEIIDGTSTAPAADQEAFIDAQFAVFLDPAEAKTALLGPSNLEPEEKKQAHREYILAKLLPYLRAAFSRGLVKQTLATALSLEDAMAKALLETILTSRTQPSLPAIQDFLSLMDSGVTPQDRLSDLIRLDKIARLLRFFEATPEEAAYVAAHGADFAGFDLNAMPLDRSNPSGVDAAAPALFASWEKLRAFFSLRDGLPSGDLTLLDVLAAPTAAEARTQFASLTGWPIGDVEFLAGPQGLGLSDASFKTAEGPRRLSEAFALKRQIGVSVQSLRAWSVQPPDAVQAQDVVQAVKAKYDDATWLTVGKSLNDGLRQKRKAALIAYVLSDASLVQKKISTSNQLLEYFLIDVNMEACMLTSRIKQAVSAVQLFIHRCLMNLEPEVSPALLSAERFKSLKNYRVWEASRKVFLYPENWIEWELRDDKSIFAQEMEAQLLQGDVTQESAEKAFRDYLGKVETVSSLEIASFCHQQEGSGADKVDRVHVFGRTRNIPRIHYYRSLNVTTGIWTAWEKLEADIESGQPLPVSYNRRLYLFWLVFTEKSGPWTEDDFPHSQPESDSAPVWDIRLAWSERKGGEWSPKKTAAESIESPSYGNQLVEHYTKQIDGYPEHLTKVTDRIILPDPGSHTLRATVTDDLLEIEVFRADVRSEESDPYHTERIGRFTLGSYGDRVTAEMEKTVVPPEALGRLQPQNGNAREMTYWNWGNSPLTIEDVKNGNIEPLPLLERSGYEMAYPPRLEQTSGGSRYFAFLYWFQKRTFLALPFRDNYKLSTPSLSLGAAVLNDALMNSFQTAYKSLAYKATDTASASPGKYVMGNSSTRVMAKSKSPVMTAMKSSESSSSSSIGASAGLANQAVSSAAALSMKKLYERFYNFYHPHMGAFLNALERGGVPELLTLKNQKLDNDALAGSNVFKTIYEPTEHVHKTYPKENVDFDGGAYAIYNWEIFFHGPMLIAGQLFKNQRFQESLNWIHYVFNPTATSAEGPSPKRYWRVLPFQKTAKERLEELLKKLSSTNYAEKKEMIQQVEAWRDNPFNPHLIARSRLLAYQKAVVMKYIDTLLGWADQLFAQDTLETLNEATHLYVLAYDLLGPRPERVPPRGTIDVKCYAELKSSLDDFSNALVQMENEIPFAGDEALATDDAAPGLGYAEAFYFCIPQNEKLLQYWGTVEDRLFKIRHCMNIEGEVRQLPLFEPPIDPALLVKAAAAGLDLGSVLNDLHAPMPFYRFPILLQKGLDLVNEVRSLGASFLSVLEKKDAEALSLLRASQDALFMQRIKEIKKQQIDEARRSLESLQKSQESTRARERYYRDISDRIPEEILQISEMEIAQASQRSGESSEQTAGDIATYLPDFSAGASTMGPYAGTTMGRANVIAGFQADASEKRFDSAEHTFQSTRASVLGSWQRRSADWRFQADVATRELAQIAKQIAAAEIRVAIAEKELDNQLHQIENAQSIEAFMKDKYTQEDLYGWMVSQLSGLYFQTYKLAYDAAKRAERAYRFELGLTSSEFIQFGYWDSLKKGLLAGEKLAVDLKRMDSAFLDKNRRELEISKPVSLCQLDAAAWIALKQNGVCEVELSEALFDGDYPGHYLRRIRNVSLTCPAVIGPYMTINCTLTLLSSKVRIDPTAQGDYLEDTANDDPRFSREFGSVQSIATSTGQNDAGVFEVNFRDERYLPCEGAGAISRWRLELRRETNAFNIDTLSDVILQLRYTARDGGALLKKKAWDAVIAAFPKEGLTRLFSARHEFPDEWFRFLHPAEEEDDQILKIDLSQERFPFNYRNQEIRLNGLRIFLKLKEKISYDGGNDLAFTLSEDGGVSLPESALVMNPALQLPSAQALSNGQEPLGTWSLTVPETGVQAIHPALRQKVTLNNQDHWRLKADAIDDLWIVAEYSVTE